MAFPIFSVANTQSWSLLAKANCQGVKFKYAACGMKLKMPEDCSITLIFLVLKLANMGKIKEKKILLHSLKTKKKSKDSNMMLSSVTESHNGSVGSYNTRDRCFFYDTRDRCFKQFVSLKTVIG